MHLKPGLQLFAEIAGFQDQPLNLPLLFSNNDALLQSLSLTRNPVLYC